MKDEDAAILARGRIEVLEEREHHCQVAMNIGKLRKVPLTLYVHPSVVWLIVEAIQNAEAPLRRAIEQAMKTTGISPEAWDVLHAANKQYDAAHTDAQGEAGKEAR